MIIGLTGQSGAGKTTASKIFEENGFFVIDADKVSRAVSKNKDCLSSLVSVFSEDILSENGELNRKKLGSIVFSDEEKLELLNKTIFPYIIKEIEEISIQNSDKNIVLDAPTLFESGLHTSCDIIVSAIANRDLRIKRITERDGISLDDALKRINSQKTEEFFRSNSDYIIENNNGLGELKAASLNVVNSIKEKIFEKA